MPAINPPALPVYEAARNLSINSEELSNKLSSVYSRGNLRRVVVTTSEAYTVDMRDGEILIDDGIGSYDITLPYANTWGDGNTTILVFRRLGNAANTYRLVPSGSDTVNGGASLTLPPYATVTMMSNGLNAWNAIGNYSSTAFNLTQTEVRVSTTPQFRGSFTITDASIIATSKVMVWQAPGPYTGKGTRADECEMDRITCLAIPASGSATVKWETIGYISLKHFPPTTTIPTRVGRVRGWFKFFYTVG